MANTILAIDIDTAPLMAGELPDLKLTLGSSFSIDVVIFDGGTIPPPSPFDMIVQEVSHTDNAGVLTGGPAFSR